jgi:chaperonin GroEL
MLLNATRAAVEEGIIVGGGAALAHATKALDGFKTGNEEYDFGVRIVKEQLKSH